MKKGSLKLSTGCGILESCFFTLFHSSVNAGTSFIFPIIIIIIIIITIIIIVILILLIIITLFKDDKNTNVIQVTSNKIAAISIKKR